MADAARDPGISRARGSLRALLRRISKVPRCLVLSRANRQGVSGLRSRQSSPPTNESGEWRRQALRESGSTLLRRASHPRAGSMQDAGCGGRSTTSDRPCDDRAIRAAAVAGHGERLRPSRDRWRFRAACNDRQSLPIVPRSSVPPLPGRLGHHSRRGYANLRPLRHRRRRVRGRSVLGSGRFRYLESLGRAAEQFPASPVAVLPRIRTASQHFATDPDVRRTRAFSVRFARLAPRRSGVPGGLSESAPGLRHREFSAVPALHRECSSALHPKPSSRWLDPALSSSRKAFVHRADRSRVALEPCPWEPATPERRSPTTRGEPSRATRPLSPGDFPG